MEVPFEETIEGDEMLIGRECLRFYHPGGIISESIRYGPKMGSIVSWALLFLRDGRADGVNLTP